MKNRALGLFLAVVLCIVSLGSVAMAETEQTTLDRIMEDGSFTYALTGAYPPFNYIDEDTGDVIGFDVDIANALAEVMGVEAVAVTTQWDGIIGGLMGNRFDTIIGSMAITDARLEEVNFSDPYYYDGAQFFTTEENVESGINSIADLVDGKVGVVTGTTFAEMLESMDNISEVLYFDGDIENFMAAGQGRSDGLVTSRFVGLQAPEEYNIVPCGPLLYTEKIGIAIRQEDTELLDAINSALATIVENGTYEEISQKWFGTNILEQE